MSKKPDGKKPYAPGVINKTLRALITNIRANSPRYSLEFLRRYGLGPCDTNPVGGPLRREERGASIGCAICPARRPLTYSTTYPWNSRLQIMNNTLETIPDLLDHTIWLPFILHTEELDKATLREIIEGEKRMEVWYICPSCRSKDHEGFGGWSKMESIPALLTQLVEQLERKGQKELAEMEQEIKQEELRKLEGK